jgi:hypothetical protein
VKRVVYKYTVEPFSPGGVMMPQGARIVHVAEQSSEVRVWAEVDPDAPVGRRRLVAVPTGNEVPDGYEHAGSAILRAVGMPPMELVFHVYDGGEDAPVSGEAPTVVARAERRL